MGDAALMSGFEDPDVMAAVAEIAACPAALQKHASNAKVVAFQSWRSSLHVEAHRKLLDDDFLSQQCIPYRWRPSTNAWAHLCQANCSMSISFDSSQILPKAFITQHDHHKPCMVLLLASGFCGHNCCCDLHYVAKAAYH